MIGGVSVLLAVGIGFCIWKRRQTGKQEQPRNPKTTGRQDSKILSEGADYDSLSYDDDVDLKVVTPPHPTDNGDNLFHYYYEEENKPSANDSIQLNDYYTEVDMGVATSKSPPGELLSKPKKNLNSQGNPIGITLNCLSISYTHI